ncbi:MAG: amino acid permease [Myxococcota bacterium]|nr:amino acid permease [Myxococcota bacterium]
MLDLERRLGLTSVIAISLGAMLGSGLFVLPGVAATITGPSMWLAFALAGICVLPAALSKAELATAMPTSGGSYVYLERAFGPMVGTICGLGLWMSLLLKSSFALVGLTWYLEILTPINGQFAALGFLALVTALNILGVRKVGQAQVVMVALSLLGLAVLVFLGKNSFDPQLTQPFMPNGIDGLITCVAVVFISYAGVTKIAAVAEEVKNPGRNLPMGMLITLVIAAILYVLMAGIMAGNIDANLSLEEGGLQGDFRPVYSLALLLGGSKFGMVIAGLGTLTMVSMANAGLLASSRFPFSMARHRLLPKVFGQIRSTHLTPIPAILLTSGFMAVAIVTLDVAKIAKLASAFMILAFMAINLSVIVLRESHVRWYQPKFRSPLYPWVQIAGVIICIGLLAFIGLPAWLASGAVIVVGAGIYFAYGRARVDGRSGVATRLSQREVSALTVIPRPSEESLAALEVGAMVTLLDRNPPEPLIELGVALGGGQPMAVVRVREVPEQLSMQDLENDHPYELALRRRAVTMGHNLGCELEYVNAACRDLRSEVLDLSHLMQPKWVLFEWQDQGKHAVWLRDPMAWIFSHLQSNVAVFKDVGIRVFRKILVVVDHGTHDETLVRTADQLAVRPGRPNQFNGEITIAAHIKLDGDEERTQQHLAELSELCQADTRLLVLRGGDRGNQWIEQTAHFDLMLIEEPPYEHFYSRMMRRSAEHITGKASCSVLRLRIPDEDG